MQIIGEGCFHQFHGGTTTNSSAEKRNKRLAQYRTQYKEIRGDDNIVSNVPFIYMGHMPTTASNISAVERRRARLAQAREEREEKERQTQ